MVEFLTGPDLWANIIGGVFTAGFIALIAFIWDRRKHRIIHELIEIMRGAVLHRNIGEQCLMRYYSAQRRLSLTVHTQSTTFVL